MVRGGRRGRRGIVAQQLAGGDAHAAHTRCTPQDAAGGRRGGADPARDLRPAQGPLSRAGQVRGPTSLLSGQSAGRPRRATVAPDRRRAGLQRLLQTLPPSLAPSLQSRHGRGSVAAERIERFATPRAQDAFSFTFCPPALQGIRQARAASTASRRASRSSANPRPTALSNDPRTLKEQIICGHTYRNRADLAPRCLRLRHHLPSRTASPATPL